jgi:uncharacterized membrane protein
MYCQSCGSEISANAQFCAKCGAAQQIAGAAGGNVAAAPAYAAPVYRGAKGWPAQTSQWIGQGWDAVKDDLGIFVVMTIVMMVVNGFVPFLLQGATTAGFQGAFKRKLRGQKADLGDMFQGFQFFVPTLVAHLLISLYAFLAFLCFIIPGLVVAAMYSFTFLFIIDKRMDYGAAMRASREVVKQDYVGYTLFLVALMALNIVGALCLIVGLLVTIPISMAAIAVAYQDVVGFE